MWETRRPHPRAMNSLHGGISFQTNPKLVLPCTRCIHGESWAGSPGPLPKYNRELLALLALRLSKCQTLEPDNQYHKELP